MALTITLLLATLLAAALLATALTPTRIAVWLGCAANVVQLHTISILGIYPSFALLCWLSPWRSVLAGSLWRWGWMQSVLALALIQAVSLSWSPNPLLGARYLIYFLPLPFAAHAVYRLTREDPAFARKCIRVLLLGSSVEAVFVIVFRLLPSVEIAFLNSPIATFFTSVNALQDLLYGIGNNVLDPAKSGGLFTNANVASAYLGISAIAAWYVSRVTRSRALRAVALLDWAAVLFSGSKAGLLLAIALPVGLAVISVIRARQARPATMLAASLALGLGAVVLALPTSQELVDQYRHNALMTLGSRQELWSYAGQLVEQHALTGLGFGGWEQRFALYSAMTGTAAMPAHNSLFIIWLQSGLPGLVGGLLFVTAVYAAVARTLSVGTFEMHHLSMAMAGALSWYFIQGLGENYGLIGEVHMTPLIGALLGHLCARYDAAALERHEHRTESMRGAAAPSAVPAV